MSSLTIIADQWYCLTEPERALAKIVATNGGLMLGQVVYKDYADDAFAAARGAPWEIYRDFWMANWAMYETTLEIMGVEIDVYATTAAWPTGIIPLCTDCPDDVPCRCVQVTGFPPPC